MTITTLTVQERLSALGFDPGPRDGVRGRRTIAAVRAFQAVRGLAVDGLVGAATAAALFDRPLPAAGLPDGTPWMDVAERMVGLHEKLDHQAVASFLASDGGTVGDPAERPWCADFVQTCVALSLPQEPVPANPYASISWTRFGYGVAPCYGAILCFWRDDPQGWKGHVGFCVDVSEHDVLLRGGNQSDRISEMRIDRTRLRPDGSRWPTTALPPVGPM